MHKDNFSGQVAEQKIAQRTEYSLFDIHDPGHSWLHLLTELT